MKHYLKLFIAMVILFSSVNFTAYDSGNEKFRLVKLIYENSSGENGVTHFDYDENGLNNVATWELVNGNRYSINFYFYDNDRNMIKKVREYSDHKNTVQLFKYDGKNRLISEEFILLDTTRGVTTFEYNSANQLVQINCSAYNGWLNGVIKIYYNPNGQKEKGELFQNEKSRAKIFYQYDSSGNLTKEVWEFDPGWKQTFIYEYYKHDDGKEIVYSNPNPFAVNLKVLVNKEDYSYGDKISGPSYYSYSSSGKLIKKLFERSDGFWTDTYYIYAGDGTLVRTFRRYSNNKNALFRYRYNENRKMVEKEFFMSDKKYGREIFHYDSAGLLSSGEYDNSDLWLNGTITFENGKDGLPVKGFYKDKKGFTADVVFEYDTASLLKKIIWKFSDGSEQVYSYFY
ncbi:MAG: hypothetical protein AB1521_00505 [Bacteroidota bacterium]